MLLYVVHSRRNLRAVNFIGVVRCCKVFLPILKQQSSLHGYKGARILNVTSMAGVVPTGVGLGAYSCSKFAAQAFSEALSYELQSWGIQVATINPSFHKTPICDNLDEKAHQQWEQLPASLREEYGLGTTSVLRLDEYEYSPFLLCVFDFVTYHPFFLSSEYLEELKDLMRRSCTMSMWNMSVVVDQIVKTLKRSHVPTKILIGSDGRFALVAFRMLPDWATELFMTFAAPRPKPAVMCSK
jgi:hypothetical protein